MMLGEEHPEMGCQDPQSLGGTPVNLYLYVEDADQAYTRAVSAGAKADKPMADMFWGDRCGQLTDPFGYRWHLAMREKNRTPEEIKKRAGRSLLKWRHRPGRTGIHVRYDGIA
jgi:PhnB protein